MASSIVRSIYQRAHLLALNRFPQLGLEPLFDAWSVADLYELDFALRVNQHEVRDAAHAILGSDRAVRVHRHGEGVVVALQELAHGVGVFLEVNRKDVRVLAVLVSEFLGVRQGASARSAPCRPEVDKHRLAAQFAQFDGLAVQRGQFEIGGVREPTGKPCS
jgi:hypothetical protein